eukprot:gnl/Spiro4/2538_TR1223_c0_g1_i1.p1 gnl/Spiro4/2538_TR1223_c0_g1~~gnl/Spiro4/2538_TR1223_c0_g1_i1.p1  ORF type:complete len:351 (+),score=99.60 gnl/Spiro4/2538_TR1223_c0_g1_i1:140-1192(+)
MAQFTKIWQERTSFPVQYFQQTRAAEEARVHEFRQAVKLSSLWRGYCVRKRLYQWEQAAKNIQRVFRGYLGRKRFIQEWLNRQREDRARFFDAMAIIIQRVWRGYRSRKHIHDFYLRKRFLADVVAKNAELARMSEQEALRQAAQLAKELEAAEQEELENLARKKHHLLSTAAIRGLHQDDKFLEDSMRSTRSGSRTRTAAPAQIAMTSPLLSAKRMISSLAENPEVQARKVQGPFKKPEVVAYQRLRPTKPTLRNDTRYGRETELARRDGRVSKFLRVAPNSEDFKPARISEARAPPSLLASVPYSKDALPYNHKFRPSPAPAPANGPPIFKVHGGSSTFDNNDSYHLL